VNGFKLGLGDKASSIVKEVTYEVTDPTIDSQIISLQGTGANVFLDITTPKFAAQAIRKIADIGWKPTHFLTNVSISIGAVMVPAGVDKGAGIISTRYLKDASDPEWASDKGMQDFVAWTKKYMPDADLKDLNLVYGYTASQTMVQVLKQCGDELTHENVMKQAASLKDLQLPLLVPGIKINTSPTHFYPIDQEQLIKFDGKTWVGFGAVLSGS
jgi:ABC-type branched-subunit amino acid transport system substrate-binding protein